MVFICALPSICFMCCKRVPWRWQNMAFHLGEGGPDVSNEVSLPAQFTLFVCQSDMSTLT